MDAKIDMALKALLQDSLTLPGLMGLKQTPSSRNTPMMLSPMSRGYGGLETFPTGETGDKFEPRPPGLPINQPGVRIYDPGIHKQLLDRLDSHVNSPGYSTSENLPIPQAIDIAGEMAGHVMNNPKEAQFSPELSKLYQQFAGTLDPQMLHGRYQHAVQSQGEQRPFQDWATASGIPALFRGYTFKQWPDEFNKKMYSPEQMGILDRVRELLKID